MAFTRLPVLALLVGCIWVLPSCGLEMGGADDDASATPDTQGDQRTDVVTSNAVDSAAE